VKSAGKSSFSVLFHILSSYVFLEKSGLKIFLEIDGGKILYYFYYAVDFSWKISGR
jgi:hypothetical protein